MRTILIVLGLAICCVLPRAAWAEAPTLTLSFGGHEQEFTADELLARPDDATIAIPEDVSYRRAMTYRAVPLLDLLRPETDAPFDTIEARATDGFVSQIPFDLVRRGAHGGAVAWVAIEPPQKPWPDLPGKDTSAGSFYLVWEHPERSGVGTEQWPFALSGLKGVESPAHRWPQMAVAESVPAGAPARRGQAVFIRQCLPCHRMEGAVRATWGPISVSP